MKIFEKRNLKNGRRHIYFCGIKIMSYTKHQHIHKTPNEIIAAMGVQLGDNVRFIIHPNSWDYPDFGSEPYLISIGDDTCISFGCTFLTHDASIHVPEHIHNTDVTRAGFGEIHIGKNCFVGCRCIFLPGVKIGDNCIIGAGSVVTKSVPSGEILAGNPAHFISTVEEYTKKLIKNNKTKKAKELYDIVCQHRQQN